MRWLVVLLLVANVAPARAGDRIDELTTQLSSSSEKTRLTAVVSCGEARYGPATDKVKAFLAAQTRIKAIGPCTLFRPTTKRPASSE